MSNREPGPLSLPPHRNTGGGRDPKRIARMMIRFMRLWTKYPDLRLGQLVMNLGGDGTYNIEDDEMERRIRQVLDTGQWPQARD